MHFADGNATVLQYQKNFACKLIQRRLVASIVACNKENKASKTFHEVLETETVGVEISPPGKHHAWTSGWKGSIDPSAMFLSCMSAVQVSMFFAISCTDSWKRRILIYKGALLISATGQMGYQAGCISIPEKIVNLRSGHVHHFTISDVESVVQILEKWVFFQFQVIVCVLSITPAQALKFDPVMMMNSRPDRQILWWYFT